MILLLLFLFLSLWLHNTHKTNTYNTEFLKNSLVSFNFFAGLYICDAKIHIYHHSSHSTTSRLFSPAQKQTKKTEHHYLQAWTERKQKTKILIRLMALKSAIASRKLNTQFQLRLNRQVLNPSSKIPQNKKSPSSVSKQKKKNTKHIVSKYHI